MARRRFEIEAIFKARDEASGPVKRAESSFKGLGASITKFRALALGAVGAVAGITAAIASSVKAAAEAEQANLRLATSAQKYGDAANDIVRSASAQAGALQRLTGVSDEVIKSQQAVLLQMGVLPGQLGDATQAAVDLSAALGISLESAFRNVGRTVGGYAGELGELVPELKELSVEQLRAGEGIDFLADKFDGAAEGARGLSVAISALFESFSDSREVFGESITAGDQLTESVTNLTRTIDALNTRARQNQAPGFFARLSSAVTDFANAAAQTIFLIFPEQIEKIEEEARKAAPALENLGKAAEEMAGSSADAVRASEALNTVLEELGVTLEADVVAQTQLFELALTAADEALRRGEISARDYAAIQAAISNEVAESADVIEDQATALGTSTTAMQRYVTGARAATIANAELTSSFERLIASQSFAETGAVGFAGTGFRSPSLERNLTNEQVAALAEATIGNLGIVPLAFGAGSFLRDPIRRSPGIGLGTGLRFGSFIGGQEFLERVRAANRNRRV